MGGAMIGDIVYTICSIIIGEIGGVIWCAIGCIVERTTLLGCNSPSRGVMVGMTVVKLCTKVDVSFRKYDVLIAGTATSDLTDDMNNTADFFVLFPKLYSPWI